MMQRETERVALGTLGEELEHLSNMDEEGVHLERRFQAWYAQINNTKVLAHSLFLAVWVQRSAFSVQRSGFRVWASGFRVCSGSFSTAPVFDAACVERAATAFNAA
eukprot:2982319-Rhodomonas_salina.4